MDPLADWRPEDAPSVPRAKLAAKYTIQKSLGKGGFGEVFLAVHKSTGISRAVKRVRRDNREADDALQKELDVMLRLTEGCEHVVQVKDAFVDDEYRYLVLELCFGLDLVDSIIEELAGDDGDGLSDGMLEYHQNVPHVAAVFRPPHGSCCCWCCRCRRCCLRGL